MESPLQFFASLSSQTKLKWFKMLKFAAPKDNTPNVTMSESTI